MISIWLVVGLLTTHFVADFILQSDWMALNKSKSWDALLAHTSVYACCFLPFGVAFALVTFVLHTLTDAITSRITSRLWFIDFKPRGGITFSPDSNEGYEYFAHINGKRHYFFVMIGLDQLIHAMTLIWTAKVFIG